jgi:dihydroorotate dehydrogenase (NAD+) catalytic subunit
MKPDLRVEIAGIPFKNPVLVASGTFGYGEEFADFIDLDALGGVEVCRRLEKAGHVDMIELNVSCPNVDEGGMEFGVDETAMIRVIGAVREVTTRPIIAKLSPNVTSIALMARAAKEGGAAAVSLINTLVGLAINVLDWRPRLSNTTGGLSGPAVKPVAVAMVHKVSRAVDIPIIGIGGIASAEDAVEFHLVGAHAVQIGTANFINPNTSMDVIAGLEKYLSQRKLSSIHDIIGKARI